MTMHSSIYRGLVSHRRFGTARNDFRYRLAMLYLELGELDTVFEGYWLWSSRGPAPAWFRRRDHYGDGHQSLDTSVRDLVEREAGFRPTGPIRLLTHLRYFGYCFNPLSAYYCFDAAGDVTAVVLEVSNMPWREMHPYVLTAGTPVKNGGRRYGFAKQFHVSPFLPPDMDYRCTLAPPTERLALALENWRGGQRVFDAHLSLQREPITHTSLARLLATDPLATLRVTALIHWQALRLWRKKARIYDHPKPRPGNAGEQNDRAAA